ncbi:MAG: glycosyltransferase [Eubacterium sp.]
MISKKNILICSHAMEIGGAERSLLDLLYTFNYSKYNVDLFLYRHSGEWLKDIPEQVNLLPESPKYSSLLIPIKSLIAKKQFGILFSRLAGKFFAFLYRKKHNFTHSAVEIEYSHKYTRFFLPKIKPDKEYDLAISFLTPHYFVRDKVRAKKKIAWIHTDYSTIEINVKSELKMWSSYDKIISISNDCTKSFLKKFPSLSDKILEVENILSSNLISKKCFESAPEEMSNNTDYKILSIGRFSDAKNFDNVPEICKKICTKGLNIIWYLIGYGGDEQLIKNKITEFGMENNVIILGKKENPYPYIKACDAYIQPSRYEGKCVAVREAQILEKPVIITNYATANSQLKDGYDGVIVPMDNEGCAEGIYKVLTDEKLMKQLSYNCSQNDYTNFSEIYKLYDLI